MKRLVVCAILSLSLAAGAGAQKRHTQRAARSPSFKTITTDKLMSHIRTLSSDEFEGRAPGSHGEELSINYVADQFKQAGLAPGNTDGTYFQKVPLAGIAANKDATLHFKTSGK